MTYLKTMQTPATAENKKCIQIQFFTNFRLRLRIQVRTNANTCGGLDQCFFNLWGIVYWCGWKNPVVWMTNTLLVKIVEQVSASESKAPETYKITLFSRKNFDFCCSKHVFMFFLLQHVSYILQSCVCGDSLGV